MLTEAKNFITQMYSELNYDNQSLNERLTAISAEITDTGSYTHTYEELSYGAKMAWRNSNRCIGRFFWNTLTVQDARDVDDEDTFIASINHHINEATNNGKIKPFITIYHPEQIGRAHV